MILAIDTSTPSASIALFDKHPLGECSWMADRSHTTQLPVEIERMMSLLKVGPRHLTGIAVAIGPGSFNGLRVGLSEAKGFSLSLGIPIVGISTLEVMAYENADVGLPIRPVLDAGRDEVSTGLYELRAGKWKVIEQPWTAGEADLLSKLSHPTFLCGDVHKDVVQRVVREKGSLVKTPAVTSFRHAGFLAHLAARRFQRNDLDDPATLQPIYLKRPGITKSTRKDALAVNRRDEKGGVDG